MQHHHEEKQHFTCAMPRAACRFHARQAALRCPDLWQEAALLRRLLYKNSGQHHGSLHMRRLRHVSRLLAALQGADAAGALGDLQAMTHLAGSSTSIATGASLYNRSSRLAGHGRAGRHGRAAAGAPRFVHDDNRKLTQHERKAAALVVA